MQETEKNVNPFFLRIDCSASFFYISSDMFLFILSVKHPSSFLYHSNIWSLLEDTLYSILGQTCDNYKVVVVCDTNESEAYNDNDKVDFVYTNTSESMDGFKDLTSPPSTQIDRGFRNAAGLVHSRIYDPKYVMFVDVGDFVYSGIVESALPKDTQSGWYFDRGLCLRNFQVSYKNQIHKLSASSHILNYKELTRQIDLGDGDKYDTYYEFIKKNMHPYFIRNVLGGSVDYDAFFHNKDYPIKAWPHSESVVYNLGYSDVGFQCSGTLSKDGVLVKLKGWHPAVDDKGKVNLSLAKYNVPPKYLKKLK